MIPAWINRGEGNWTTGWLVDGSPPSGSGENHILVAYDEQPHATWKYPLGSLKLARLHTAQVRIRRTAVPLLDPVPHEAKK